MILEKNTKFIETKKFVKTKFSKYYFFLFLATLFFVLTIIAVLFLSDKTYGLLNSEKFREKSNRESYFVLITFFFILSLLEFFLFMNSLAAIVFNKYYKFNIFRAIKWLKIKLIFSFNFSKLSLFTSDNSFSKKDIDLLKYMAKNNYVLQGSKAIAYKFKDFWRKTNDFDFISSANLPNTNSLKSLEGLSILYIDNIVGKLNYNDSIIEILFYKYIPKIYCKQVKDILIPNIYWMVAMKFIQFFKLYLVNTDKKILTNEKIENALLDLAFLLSKLKSININKIEKYIEYLLISDFFLSYYLNNFWFDKLISTTKNFEGYLKEKLEKLEIFCELNFFFKEIIAKIRINDHLNKMINAMSEISKQKEKIEMNFLNLSSSENKEVSSLKRIFKNQKEKNNFVDTNYLKYPIKSKSISSFINDLKNRKNASNEIDIRIMILYELNKRMVGN
ncbi:MAG4530 family protein [Metamycoplasma equirhinis]|uniref:MAG4530 family protein n=1 Tax=Metamycoplasma equirhinis TaxID=92402 RepID=UPI003594388F